MVPMSRRLGQSEVFARIAGEAGWDNEQIFTVLRGGSLDKVYEFPESLVSTEKEFQDAYKDIIE